MKTEYKKVSELLTLENEEVLKEFEMVELKGGKDLVSSNVTAEGTCGLIGSGCSNALCPCTGGKCY